ncbi:Transcription factor BOA [Gracilariopsis chorda]|uniref:Transcription factor BOA n=1 Tax=Gracilariopsis chorda TaxID=448386 RepID=A0A2V3J6D2_9FLOR|nr:Transcription factor BOA [Gracilariopsis chorda]|eukprot:PXF49986.1 Transcription factor BOA [Gracilariopsis chorda]
MNPEQQQASLYPPGQTQQGPHNEHAYARAWTSQPPLRYEHVPSTSAVPGVVTMTVYAVPCAYTANNEPLFLQFGTQTAAEAARYAINLEQRYWQMRSQAEARGEYTRSPATLNRSGKPYDPTIPQHNDRYDPYESGYLRRNTQNYEYPYPSTDATQATRTEYNVTTNQSAAYDPQQQHCSQVQGPVYAEPDIARSVVPDISRTQPVTAVKDSYNEANASTAVHIAPVNRDPTFDTEDRCSDRSRRDPGQLSSTHKEQSVHHDSNDIRDTSRHNTNVHDASNPTDVDTKRTNCTGSEKATRARGSKRYSEGQSQNTDERPKRSRLNWSPKLHASFLAAVQKLGIEHAVPTAIIREMKAEGLSRENVASHLQKYRSMLKKEKEDAEKRELLETLKTLMENDPNNPQKSLTDEDVLKVAAERKRSFQNSKSAHHQAPTQGSANPLRNEAAPSKERCEATSTNPRPNR